MYYTWFYSTQIKLLQEQISESRQLREDYIRKVGKHDSEIQELRSAMSQHVQKMQPTMAMSSLTTQDSSDTSLLSSSNASNLTSLTTTTTKPIMLTTFNKDEELTDISSPLKFSAVSPKTSTPYKRQSLPHVTSPLPHNSPTSELVKPANKFV